MESRPHEGPGVICLLWGEVAWWELDGKQTNTNRQETQPQWDWLWRVQSVPVIGNQSLLASLDGVFTEGLSEEVTFQPMSIPAMRRAGGEDRGEGQRHGHKEGPKPPHPRSC